MALFGAFLAFMVVPKFRSSFWSSDTGGDFARSFFLDSEDDEHSVRIFNCNRKLWREIEEDVKLWTRESWGRWIAERPEWFTPTVIASIPDVFIPSEQLEALGGRMRDRRLSASHLD